MNNRTLFRAGVASSIVAALCCVTPVLAIVLVAIGLGAWVAHLDAVLLPTLGLSLALTLFAWWRTRRDAAAGAAPAQDSAPPPADR